MVHIYNIPSIHMKKKILPNRKCHCNCSTASDHFISLKSVLPLYFILFCFLVRYKRGGNVVISREIHAENNQSLWTINGRHSNQKSVEEEVRNLHIQVSNLCQFLPQVWLLVWYSNIIFTFMKQFCLIYLQVCHLRSMQSCNVILPSGKSRRVCQDVKNWVAGGNRKVRRIAGDVWVPLTTQKLSHQRAWTGGKHKTSLNVICLNGVVTIYHLLISKLTYWIIFKIWYYIVMRWTKSKESVRWEVLLSDWSPEEEAFSEVGKVLWLLMLGELSCLLCSLR